MLNHLTTQGCYECSQRRIDCDGTRPDCNKCTTRGIECSGFGVKFKFRDGFSAARKVTGEQGAGSGSGTKRSHLRPQSNADSQSTTPTTTSTRTPPTKPTIHQVSCPTNDFSTLIDDSPFDFDLLNLDGGIPDSLPLISLTFPPDEWSMLFDGGESGVGQVIRDGQGNGDGDGKGDGDSDGLGSGDVRRNEMGQIQAPDATADQALVPTNFSHQPFRKITIAPELGHMDSWKQYLLTYCEYTFKCRTPASELT